jgi:hypothetical protein
MDHIGIDVHKQESQLCILGEDDPLSKLRIRTTPERFAAVLGDRPRTRILLEASTESEWVARCLERLGHEVIVADPNFAPMYAARSRKIKTDRRDARAPAEACRLGAYRPAHRLSDAQRHVRGRLTVRDALVRTRTGYISDPRPAPTAWLALSAHWPDAWRGSSMRCSATAPGTNPHGPDSPRARMPSRRSPVVSARS